jgi:DnaK suppressor protein
MNQQSGSVGEVTGAGLTREQLALLRETLEATRARLLARRASDEDVVRTEREPESEPMEAARRTLEEDDAILATERERAQLGDIDAALARMAAGTYGQSELSGAPIGFARLQVIPWARRTADEEE